MKTDNNRRNLIGEAPISRRAFVASATAVTLSSALDGVAVEGAELEKKKIPDGPRPRIEQAAYLKSERMTKP